MINILKLKNQTTSYTSPLAGEVGFQYEQRLANIRKPGEGYRNLCSLLPLTQDF
jgi:hypothetical protein